MKIIERAKEIDKLNQVEVPYFCWVLFGDAAKNITISDSSQICLGEDYKSIDEIRAALDWYADQFGGKIKWSKK